MGKVVFVAEAQDLVVIIIKQLGGLVSLNMAITKGRVPSPEVALPHCGQDRFLSGFPPCPVYERADDLP